jgi:hypothetical protein
VTDPTPANLIAAFAHSMEHRNVVLASTTCGCFACKKTFASSEITEWTDEEEGVGQTALCPKCGQDTVIGSASGIPLTPEFLGAMKKRWFSA